jgi:hypothetical protein|tara:strand:+ start:1776 stop:2192 length:417 start_codon:yes stop_codon:yes gene_type:complete
MMLEVRREYEQRQGYEIDDKSRLNHYVQDRVALANALRPYATYKDIGEIFGKDHATVIHYCREHEAMMNSYPSYMVRYENALSLTSRVSDRMAIAPKVRNVKSRNLHAELATIKRTINKLQKFQKKIEDKLGINEEAS